MFLHSGARLATSSGDGTVKIWDFSKAECILTFTDHTHAVWGCSWHSCGDFLASCSMDNTSKVWDVNRYKRKPIGSFSNDVGEGNENVQKKITDRFIKQNNNSARASHFFVHFIAFTARLLRDFTFYGGRKQTATNFSFSLSTVPKKSTTGKFAYIFSKMEEMRPSLKKTRIHLNLTFSSFINLACLVKMAHYWPLSFVRFKLTDLDFVLGP